MEKISRKLGFYLADAAKSFSFGGRDDHYLWFMEKISRKLGFYLADAAKSFSFGRRDDHYLWFMTSFLDTICIGKLDMCTEKTGFGNGQPQ